MSFDKALKYCQNKKVFIIGGLNTYELFLPYINEFHVTTINKIIGRYPNGLNLPKDFFKGFEEVRKTVLSDMATVQVLQRV
jgi:dihydrofolate reductase